MVKANENEVFDESIYEEERLAQEKKLNKEQKKQKKVDAKQQKKEEKESLKQEKVQKKLTARQKKLLDYKRRIKKAHKKARHIGWWYVFFTVIVAASAFLPLFISIDGEFSVLTIWNALFKLKLLDKNFSGIIVGLLGTIFYTFIIFTVIFNAVKAFKCIKSLYFKKPSYNHGYNRPAQGMMRLGDLFSGSLITLVLFAYLMRVLASVELTPLFWGVVFLGIIVHFWLGLRSGGVSFFTVDKKREVKRMGGKMAPFLRNLFQILVVSVIMKYFLETNLILNLINVLGGLPSSAGVFTNFLLPVIHILMLVCIIMLVNHALRAKEFHHDGKRAPGRKEFRTVSSLLLLASVVSFVFTFIVSNMKNSGKFSMSYGSLYIAVLALAAIIEEFSLRNYPRLKDNVIINFEPDMEPIPVVVSEEGDAQSGYHVPISCIKNPGVFMQPNGQPIMVMPMIAGPQKITPVSTVGNYENDAPVAATPVSDADAASASANAKIIQGVGVSREELQKQALREMEIARITDKWLNMAKNPPMEREEREDAENFSASNPFISEIVKLQEVTSVEPQGDQSWTVACPDCGASVQVQSGSFAYRCTACDCVFKIRNKEE